MGIKLTILKHIYQERKNIFLKVKGKKLYHLSLVQKGFNILYEIVSHLKHRKCIFL